MAKERTLSIIKPDATRRNLTGAINAKIEAAGLRIIAQKRVKWKKADAETFYKVHKERPFYKDLVKFMTSGPVVIQVLEGDDAVTRYRDVMGATNPANAAEGTIRKLYALSVGENSVHGSDSLDNAIQQRIRTARRQAVQVIERRSPSADRSRVALAATLPAVAWNLFVTLSPVERVSWIVWAWIVAMLMPGAGRRVGQPDG